MSPLSFVLFKIAIISSNISFSVEASSPSNGCIKSLLLVQPEKSKYFKRNRSVNNSAFGI